MKPLCAGVLLAAVLGLSCGAVKAREHYNRALEADEAGRHDEAVAEYSRAISFQENVETIFRRGVAYWRLKKYSEAMADFDWAIRLEPKHDLAVASRGGVQLELGENRRAIDDYSRAISIFEETGSGDRQFFVARRALMHAARALAYVGVEDYTKARMDLERASQLDRDYLQPSESRRLRVNLRDWLGLRDEFQYANFFAAHQSIMEEVRRIEKVLLRGGTADE